MLNNGIGFKNWLYREAFELPFDNIRKIYEYYEDGFKQYLKAPRTKIPPKLIPLDFSGSKYDFLQYLNPYVEIYLKGTLINAAGIYHGISQNHFIAGEPNVKIGKISLSFYNHEHVSYSTIEHEVLHFIQDLIKYHSKDYSKKQKSTYGGLPPMPLVKRLMKDREIDVSGNKKERRTKHEYRPIEFYTNLNSLIRSLQYYYVLLGIELEKGVINNSKFLNFNLDNLDPFIRLSDWVSNKKNKQAFLKKFIDRKDYVVSDLEKIKNLDEELYKIYIKEIYKNFIDNDKFASSASEIKKIIDSMEKSKLEKENAKTAAQKKKQEKKEKLKEKVLLGDWTEADFVGRITLKYYDVGSFSDIYESDKIGYTNSEIAEEMFREIGLKPNDNEEIRFGISAKNLTKIFDKIKKAKNTFSKTEIGKELDQTKIDNNFDYMAKALAENIYHQLRINSWDRRVSKVPSEEEILNIFYRN